MTRTIERQCAICGEDVEITLGDDDEILDGADYFGEIEFPIEETGEWVEKDEAVVYNEGEPGMRTVPREEIHEWDHHFGVTEWTGEYETVEWFECHECLEDD